MTVALSSVWSLFRLVLEWGFGMCIFAAVGRYFVFCLVTSTHKLGGGGGVFFLIMFFCDSRFFLFVFFYLSLRLVITGLIILVDLGSWCRYRRIMIASLFG